jgi:hypothetical protein
VRLLLDLTTAFNVQAHCAANDTAGNQVADVQSTFLSPPRILEPFCVARTSCESDDLIARLSFSMTVSGRLAYVLIPESPYDAASSLTPAELFQEATEPSALRTLMLQNGTVDPSHHGIVDVVQLAVNAQVPVNIVSNTSYQLLVAAEYSDASTPCCFDDNLDAIQKFMIDECRDPDCCQPSNILHELHPDLFFPGNLGLPISDVRGRVLNASIYAFEQTFALVGSAPGVSGTVIARAGGADLYTQPGADRQPVMLEVQPPLRLPVAVDMVVQQPTLYQEADTVTGEQVEGRTAYIRCATLQ